MTTTSTPQPARRATISVVIPIYNEARLVPVVIARVGEVLASLGATYEIVCVDDGSQDGTLVALRKSNAADPRVKVVALSRNFGKEAALTAGIDFAEGDAVVPLDADLQDPPELIPQMIAKWREGNDVVLAIRRTRQGDSLTKRITANLFYRVAGSMAEVRIPANAGDFRLMDRRVVAALQRMPERTRFMKGMFAWLGFRQTAIYFERPERVSGTSRWRYWHLWNFGLSGLFSFSTLPLRIWTYVGAISAFAALSYGAFLVIRTLIFGNDVPGYASLAVLVLFSAGLNMIGLGVLGEYLGRVFTEVKQRPVYLVREALGFDRAGGSPPQQ